MTMLNDISVTRLPGGLADQQEGTIFNSVPFPTKQLANFYQYFNDFMTYLAGDWTITNANGGTLALRDEAGGVLRVTNGATAAWLVSAQKVGNAFLPVIGKKFAARIRVRTDDVVNGAILAGLALTDTTPLDATDGIFILKADAAAAVVLTVAQAAGAGNRETLALGNMVNDTWFQVDLYYDGGDRLFVAVNGAVIGYLPFNSTFAPDTPITPTFFRSNGAAGASEILDIDTLWFAQER
jgi:hypothetical protein